MRPYEVMVILDAGLEEEQIRGVLDRTTKLITEQGGTPGRVDRWGKRRLAYEMDHRTEGFYAVVEAKAEPAVMSEVDRMLRLSDEVMRHKVIRIPDEVAAQERPLASEKLRSGGADQGAGQEAPAGEKTER
jgi:small subunit ribosomal protein S6